MTPGRAHPVSLADIEPWRRRTGVDLTEARQRFMQFVVLDCIAISPLGRSLAFKGGNALRFLNSNPRATVDLDFSTISPFPDDGDAIRRLLDDALRPASSRHGVKTRCGRVRRNPRPPGGTMPTYDIIAWYQFPGDRHFDSFDSPPRPIPTGVEIEISINDVVCETTLATLDPAREVRVRTCVLEDILAEKLRALLQQRLRRRHRRQDVFDIARMLRDHGREIDERKIGDYFRRKCAARDIHPAKSMFDDDIRSRASVEYDGLFDQLRDDFIPFDEAWREVLALVHRLDIPE